MGNRISKLIQERDEALQKCKLLEEDLKKIRLEKAINKEISNN